MTKKMSSSSFLKDSYYHSRIQNKSLMLRSISQLNSIHIPYWIKHLMPIKIKKNGFYHSKAKKHIAYSNSSCVPH